MFRTRLAFILAVVMTGLSTAPASAALDSRAAAGTITGTITVGPAQLSPTTNCIQHPVTMNLVFTGSWSYHDEMVGVMAHDASGALKRTASNYLPEEFTSGAVTVPLNLTLCASDGAGTYTLTGFVEGYPDSATSVSIAPAQFTVSAPVQNVTGTAQRVMITRGVKFYFESIKTRKGNTEGTPLTWLAKYDGKTKKVVQGAGERDTMKIQFKAGTGKHKVKLFANGKFVVKTVVKT